MKFYIFTLCMLFTWHGHNFASNDAPENHALQQLVTQNQMPQTTLNEETISVSAGVPPSRTNWKGVALDGAFTGLTTGLGSVLWSVTAQATLYTRFTHEPVEQIVLTLVSITTFITGTVMFVIARDYGDRTIAHLRGNNPDEPQTQETV